jgi:hypothetical protein
MALCRQALLFIAALFCCGCEGLTTRTTEYQPQEAGTVDQAMCLLGFTGIPLRAAAVTGHHLVEVELNGQRGAFVLDTGANVTVIDQRYVEQFGLEPLGGLRGQAYGIGGGQRASLARIEGLSIAGVPIRQNRIAIATSHTSPKRWASSPASRSTALSARMSLSNTALSSMSLVRFST